jgi:hypothetical protein
MNKSYLITALTALSVVLISCSDNTTNNETSADTTIQAPEAAVADTDAPAMPDSTTVTEDKTCCNCDATVYLNDPDTSGTNVRDVPGGKVIRQLKYDSDCQCNIVNVVNSKNGWIELKEGGWVFAELFSVDTRNYAEGQKVYLNESTTEESETVAEYSGEQSFKILGCDKTWLYVKGRDGKKGWLPEDMQCGNPLTTCP